MTKRLYFTCPIKSLYMMKEFGVIICKKNQDVYNWNLADLLCVNFGRIYVAPESEHIFEVKEGDYGGDFGFTGMSHVILLRDNKQFFMPEVENER